MPGKDLRTENSTQQSLDHIVTVGDDDSIGNGLGQALSTPIVASGANTNGRWVKLLDGTLICTHQRTKTSLNIDVGDYMKLSWTFPMAFQGNGTYSFNANCSFFLDGFSKSFRTLTLAEGRFAVASKYRNADVEYHAKLDSQYDGSATADSLFENLFAIGTWK